MKATINTALLSQLQPKQKPYDVRDAKVTGFLVRVNISGKLLYMCEYARGKRVTIGKVGVLSIAQARDKALAILGDAAKGVDPSKPKKSVKLTVKSFLNDAYAPWVLEHRRAGKRTLEHISRCFMKPFGDKPLADITPALIDQWRTQRLKDGKSIETVNRDVAVLKAALAKAVLWGFIDKHPLEKFKLLKSDRSIKVRYLTAKEEASLREAAIKRDAKLKEQRNSANEWRKERNYELLQDLMQCEYADHLRPMILLSINTGLRRGELFSLRWENVNFERATITIEGKYAKSGKTRHVPLNSEAKHILKAWQKQSGDTELVFDCGSGKPFDNVKTAWANLLKTAKIKHFRWHDMRHHFASKLVMACVDLNTVRELLGHSDMSMTLRYAHLAPEHKALAVEKLVQAIP
ncbi:MAG: recombinase [Gammaproteobacteria bacterium RIFCSPHIGHO2_12_FULL_40_19]|nr:MAG: recombinase [Gammaproteobacteria bacterium RIFCSPHIGHO2_12_FULL_40_19]